MTIFLHGLGLTLPIGDATDLTTAMIDKPDMESFTCDTSALSDHIPPRRLRRIDHFTRMTLLAAYRALENGNGLDPLPENLGIILCSGFGPSKTTFEFLDSLIEDGPELASPLAFSHSVHNIPAGIVSLLLGTPCPQSTICQRHAPVMAGLRTAGVWLAEGTADSVLIGATDETTPLLEELTEKFAAEQNRKAQPVGEGSVFFLLSRTPGKIALDIDTNEGPRSESYDHLWGTVPISFGFNLATTIMTVQESGQALTCRADGQSVHVSRGYNE